jgi:hypothetical protein
MCGIPNTVDAQPDARNKWARLFIFDQDLGKLIEVNPRTGADLSKSGAAH